LQDIEKLKERKLVQRLISAEPRIVEQFVRKNMPWMLRTARQILSDHALSEDAVQNAFDSIFRNLSSFEGRSKITTWMQRILINEALMLLRKKKRNKEEFVDDLLPEFYDNGCRIEPTWGKIKTPEEIFQQANASEKIMEIIQQLPADYRIVLILRDIQELTTSQTAEILGISENSTKVRLHRARAALKKLLEPLLKGGDL